VPAFPTAIAVGGVSVWVLAGNRLVRIDPTTRRVVGRIDAGVRLGSERTCDLAVAGEVVWALGTLTADRSRVIRIDARTGHILGSTPLPLAACVAATPRGAWVTLPEARAFVRLNRAGRALGQIAAHAYCDAIVAGHGAVWAACPAETAGAPVGRNTGTILRLSARDSSTVVARDVLAGALAAGPAGVYASGVGHDSGRTVRVDAPRARFRASGALAVGRSALWVVDWRGAGTRGFVRQIDAHTGRTLRRIPAGTSPLGIALGARVVWVTNYARPGRVTRIRP
jgi:hypothetical protein